MPPSLRVLPSTRTRVHQGGGGKRLIACCGGAPLHLCTLDVRLPPGAPELHWGGRNRLPPLAHGIAKVASAEYCPHPPHNATRTPADLGATCVPGAPAGLPPCSSSYMCGLAASRLAGGGTRWRSTAGVFFADISMDQNSVHAPGEGRGACSARAERRGCGAGQFGTNVPR